VCIVGGQEWFYREALPVNPPRKTVVLLHGLVAQSYSWRDVMPGLAAAGFRVVAPDWLGMGFSAKPALKEFAFTPQAYGAALGAWLKELGISQCSFAVQGFLGSVGIQYALAQPEQVERLALLNTPFTAQARLPWAMQQLGLPLIGDMLTQDPILVDRVLEGGSQQVLREADLSIYRRPFLQSSNAGRCLLAIVRNLQLKTVLPEIESGLSTWQNPLLILWGTRDPWLTLGKIPKQGEFYRLDQSAHYPQEDNPKAVTLALQDFFR
jgi:pimeloyl-ACP methyl ester carboxylesterase